ncbi:MAG: hypothetical protein Q9220_004130 [cf. Caloplaca sp. 1 TL-2023]
MVGLEPVSLGVGTVALVSLFTTCVECFEYIDAAKSYGRDVEVSTVLFAHQRSRFLIWGESVGIFPGTPPQLQPLESYHFSPIIEQTLHCICRLFDDADGLRTHYGLRVQHQTTTSGQFNEVQTLGTSRPSYKRFLTSIADRQKGTNATRKARWAIHDKQKFSGLLEDIDRLINGLEAITASQKVAIERQLLIREELESVDDHETLSILALSTTADWSDAASAVLEASMTGHSGRLGVSDWLNDIVAAPTNTSPWYEGPERATPMRLGEVTKLALDDVSQACCDSRKASSANTDLKNINDHINHLEHSTTLIKYNTQQISLASRRV